jgi:hypothetical protein
MAIVDLGTFDMITGALPVSFNSFPYRQNLAYGIKAIMTSADFNLIYSYLRLAPLITPNNSTSFLLDYNISLDILAVEQFFYFPASSLFERDGDVAFLAQRLPRWRGAGDSNPVTLQLIYDDSNTTQSWR